MLEKPKEELWNGRVDDDPTSLRYHQVVQCQEIKDLQKNDDPCAFSLIGFSCDEGVRRNLGRVGAVDAPNTIRPLLGTLPHHHPETKVIDVGNVPCIDRELEHAQIRLGSHVEILLGHNYTPIIIGGGHETVFGHYIGVRDYVGPEKTIGIINIDAHFDLRKDSTPSSGTMFSQILHQDANVGYLCLGIQPLGNTKELFDAARELDCTFMYAEEVRADDQTYARIDTFAEKYDVLMLTLCTDSITSAHAPGVSAASPYGLEPPIVKKIIRYITENKKTVSFDVSEVNPRVDEGDKTAKLAALLLADAMQSFSMR